MKPKNTILYWTPRIICIIAILFISLFALDSFDSDLSIWKQLGAFAIHLIPSFILLTFLIIALKWEFIGGIIFLIIGIGLSPVIFIKNYHMNNSIGMSLGIILTITFPFILVGILFIANHLKIKKNLH